MDPENKKIALRMIPYGLYVLTAQSGEDRVAASTVNWVTQASFTPALVAVGVKKDSGAHAVIKESGAFALNVLGKDQQSIAFTFFKPTRKEGGTLNGHKYHPGRNGAPLLDEMAAFLECSLLETVEKGDHSLFVGEVTEAGISASPSGRPDDLTLTLRDLGAKVFYGG
ncbi:MAG: flavin reductase family protein [Acidobacteriota bacterium]